MCRIYGFRASHPTRIECGLVHAQNALMRQSRRDLAGFSNADGWGLATYENGALVRIRHPFAAHHGDDFREAARRLFSATVLAHVRRATIGEPAEENTHPFRSGNWAFVHNGTVTRFADIRERLRAAIGERHVAAIEGTTDSEHLFRLLLSHLERQPQEAGSGQALLRAYGNALAQLLAWRKSVGWGKALGLNTLMTDGKQLAGTRWKRSLFFVERHGARDCEFCGRSHLSQETAAEDYRAIVIASEPLTTREHWYEIPDHSVFQVTSGLRLEITPLQLEE